MRLLSLLLNLCLPCCAILWVAGCKGESAKILSVGITPRPGCEFFYLAQAKGFYKEEGIEVRLVEFNAFSDTRRAFQQGQIEVMGITIVGVLQAANDSERLAQIVQMVDYSHGAGVLLAQPNLTSVGQLKGHKIGVELASQGVFILARALEKAGLSYADVNTVPMDQSSMSDAFRKHEIDAIVSYPPTSTKLRRDSEANPIFSTREIPEELADVIAVDQHVAEQRPEEITKFLTALNRAIAYTKDHPEEAYHLMAQREGMPVDEFKRSLIEDIRLIPRPDQATLFQPGGKLSKILAGADRVLRQTGQISGPNHCADVVNPSFVPALNRARAPRP